jgi:hypothetical protein
MTSSLCTNGSRLSTPMENQLSIGMNGRIGSMNHCPIKDADVESISHVSGLSGEAVCQESRLLII